MRPSVSTGSASRLASFWRSLLQTSLTDWHGCLSSSISHRHGQGQRVDPSEDRPFVRVNERLSFGFGDVDFIPHESAVRSPHAHCGRKPSWGYTSPSCNPLPSCDGADLTRAKLRGQCRDTDCWPERGAKFQMVSWPKPVGWTEVHPDKTMRFFARHVEIELTRYPAMPAVLAFENTRANQRGRLIRSRERKQRDVHSGFPFRRSISIAGPSPGLHQGESRGAAGDANWS
ncbi:hypothetical protein N657DRAFT_639850 [Parathielavia appendiculata]|uniref:Uncharacterized protein n=1 Tax=Parathielavia appendiculata TaxID=2587402 RepID=A0AAN6UA69_9PEZI|nr:hypothetical protein N657DRAFT_639850 [Parathielavia appendiculata]